MHRREKSPTRKAGCHQVRTAEDKKEHSKVKKPIRKKQLEDGKLFCNTGHQTTNSQECLV